MAMLAGCEAAPPGKFGDSVRALVAAQTADAGAAARNGTTVPAGTDPVRASAAVDAMRGGVAKPTETWGSVIQTSSASVEATAGN
jgi:hypothetical protein